MNTRSQGLGRGLFVAAFSFCLVFAVALALGQVVSPVAFEVQSPIPQDVAYLDDDIVWPPNAFALADLNGDDLADLVVINQIEETVVVRMSRGDGTFGDAKSFFVVDIDDYDLEPTSVAVGDVGSPYTSDDDGDVDGIPDIVLGTYDGVIVILVGDGQGDFQTRPEDLTLLLAEVSDVALADVDGDGRLDIAALDSLDEAVVMLNQTGAFDPDTDSFDTGGEELSAVEIASGDFDRNGAADLVVLNRDDLTISLLLGLGSGDFDEPQVFSTVADEAEPDQTPQDLAVADVDDDGNDDVAVINYGVFSDKQLLVRYGPGLTRKASFTAPFEATSISIDDFDGNGFVDALIAHRESTSGAAVVHDDGGKGGFSDLGAIPIPGVAGGLANASGNFAGGALPDFVQLNLDATEFQPAVNVSTNPTPTATATPSQATPTDTPTFVPSATATATTSPTSTPTATSSPTPTSTPTPTDSPSPSPSPTATSTPTRTRPPVEEDDSCTLVAPTAGRTTGSLHLLLVALALAWRRRRLR